MEYRQLNLPLTIQQNNKRFDSNYYVEGYATTFNQPYQLYVLDGVQYFEVIDSNALVGADVSNVIMQYDHSGKILARNSNNTLGIEPNEKGLFIYADLSKSTAAKDLYEEISNRLITKMSWAFAVSEDKFDSNTRTRTILKIKKIYDVSAVSIPANSETDISARSYIESIEEIQKHNALSQRMALLKLKLSLGGNR